jgi:hypothetical protein
MENIEQNTNQQQLSDIISEEEIELFYKLLPKMQEAQFFLESINNPEEPEGTSQSDKPSPYILEIDTNCKVFKKGNTATVAPEIEYHENKKFYIDFIVIRLQILYRNIFW